MIVEPTTPLEGVKPAPKPRLPFKVIVSAFIAMLIFLGFVGWSMFNTLRGAIRVGDEVPDFTLQTFDGQSVRLPDQQGKVVLVNFWASWCSTCKDEAAALEQGWQYYKKRGDVVFLGVAYVDTEKASLAYLKKYPAEYPNGPDLRSAISSIFGVTGVPETFIIGRSGRLEAVKIGPFASLEDLRSMVDPFLAH